MSVFTYPEIGSYKLPKKNVLVISCIDLRLMDNLLDFLHHDNLQNRYDHIILAGTSLCTHVEKKKELFKPDVLNKFNDFEHWKQTLYNHLDIAIALHDIRDVYIVEHEDCGAYREFLKDGEFSSRNPEVKTHKDFALTLSKQIQSHLHEKKKVKEEDEHHKVIEIEQYHLNVHCFFIDLRGNIELLDTKTHKARPKEYVQCKC